MIKKISNLEEVKMEKLTGKCHCGKNTFSVEGDAEFQFVCYCTDCRKLNSGGHLCGMVFDEDKLVKANDTQQYSYAGGSGSPIIMHFCPICSTQLYAFPTAFKGKVVVRANTLPDAQFESQQSLFVESAFAWDKSV